MSNADELLKLKELLDAGVLSQEEFDLEKQKVIGGHSQRSVTEEQEVFSRPTQSDETSALLEEEEPILLSPFSKSLDGPGSPEEPKHAPEDEEMTLKGCLTFCLGFLGMSFGLLFLFLAVGECNSQLKKARWNAMTPEQQKELEYEKIKTLGSTGRSHIDSCLNRYDFTDENGKYLLMDGGLCVVECVESHWGGTKSECRKTVKEVWKKKQKEFQKQQKERKRRLNN